MNVKRKILHIYKEISDTLGLQLVLESLQLLKKADL